MLTTKISQGIINHVALVLDGSSSMSGHRNSVVKVADELVAHLAQRSKEMDQETRVTVYVFADTVSCVIYDKDVLRLPSIKDHYRVGGMTALRDATVTSIEDLAHTWEGYGDHSFLVYVLTDGQENASRRHGQGDLQRTLAGLADNWTLGALVPDATGVHEAKRHGFAAGNVTTWNTTSATGVEEVGKVIRAATDTYMTSRSQGRRSTKSLFQVDANALNASAVKAANLTPLDPKSYVLIPVTADMPIKEFVENCTTNYQIGKAYYQLNSGRKPKGRAGVIVQGNKQVIVLEKATNKAYSGDAARKLIGLPDYEVTVDPMKLNADYDVFIQSTSLNRKLFVGTKLLMML
jgi:hypothetical protein